jgi:hypothetical protein
MDSELEKKVYNIKKQHYNKIVKEAYFSFCEFVEKYNHNDAENTINVLSKILTWNSINYNISTNEDIVKFNFGIYTPTRREIKEYISNLKHSKDLKQELVYYQRLADMEFLRVVVLNDKKYIKGGRLHYLKASKICKRINSHENSRLNYDMAKNFKYYADILKFSVMEEVNIIQEISLISGLDRKSNYNMVLENNESIYKILLPDIHSTKDYINYNLFSLTKAKERIGLSDENKKKLTKMYVNNINEALKLYNELY